MQTTLSKKAPRLVRQRLRSPKLQTSWITTIINRKFINFENDLALVAKAKAEIAERQIAILPKFLAPKVAKRLALFAQQRVTGIQHQGTHFTSPYYAEGDSSLPTNHPRNRKVGKSMRYITNEGIPNDNELRTLHESARLRKFLNKVLEEPLEDYACELSKLVFSVQSAGDFQDWHFDNNFLTLTLMLQRPERGGDLEVVPRLRSSMDENYHAVQAILDTDMCGTAEARLDRSSADNVSTCTDL
jgi:hypothetical protein